MKYKFKVAPFWRGDGLDRPRPGTASGLSMTPSRFSSKVKISFLLVLLITALLTLDYVIIRGDPFAAQLGISSLGISSARTRYVAENLYYLETGNKPNLVATKISVRPGDDGFFRVGNEIKTECTVRNNSHKNSGRFRFLIRTPRGKIVSEIVQGLSPENEYKINGVVVPEKSGVLIIACRSDVDNEIDESNEMDNREVETLYVLPQ